MIVCIDGNDGTGKSGVVERLRAALPQHTYQDRGLPSSVTLFGTSAKADMYIILSCPPEVSEARLRAAGRNMFEFWHTPPSLRFFHRRFRVLAAWEGWDVVDADRPIDEVVADVVALIVAKETANGSS
jgi:thymidylate kinase